VLAQTCASEAACTGCGVASRRCTAATTSSSWPNLRAARKCLMACRRAGSSAATTCAPRRCMRSRRPGLMTRCGRRSCSLLAVALVLGGLAGAVLTGRLSCAVSRSTLVRFFRAAADPADKTRWCRVASLRGRSGSTDSGPACRDSRRAGSRADHHRDPRRALSRSIVDYAR
jgi:hypothetical protein